MSEEINRKIVDAILNKYDIKPEDWYGDEILLPPISPNMTAEEKLVIEQYTGQMLEKYKKKFA